MTATFVTAEPDITSLVDAAVSASDVLAQQDSYQRSAWLQTLAETLRTHSAEFVDAIAADTGKPTKWAAIEVARAASISELAATQALTQHPQAQRLDAQESGSGRLALTIRVPRGPVLALAPFNFPLHLAIHKLAPAIAIGAPVILVPSIRTPRTARVLATVLADLELPAGAVRVVSPDDQHTLTWQLIGDPRIPVISFTGSTEIGWRIVDAVPRKHVVAELGGNAAALLAPDYVGADDLAHAAARIATFGYYHAGQACTSVQRVYVPQDHLEEFVGVLRTEVDTLDRAADVGPVIDDAAATRIQSWVRDAVTGGARLVIGGTGVGRLLEPTILVEPPATSPVLTDEVFGPVVSVLGYHDVDEALNRIDDSRFGLSAGIFTHEIELGFRAARRLQVGQVVLGDVPTFRSDVTAFGGVKDSGRGREGISAAIEDYTESRTVVLAQARL